MNKIRFPGKMPLAGMGLDNDIPSLIDQREIDTVQIISRQNLEAPGIDH